MLDHYRFNHSYGKLKKEITLSKRLAQTATADIEFHIEQKGNNLICTRITDEPLSLSATINTPIIIPYLQLEGQKKEMIFITSSGWIEDNVIINIYLGKQRKTIDARVSFD